MNPIVINFNTQKFLSEIYDTIDIQNAFGKTEASVVLDCSVEVVDKIYFELMKNKWVKDVAILYSNDLEAFHITVHFKKETFAKQLLDLLTSKK